MPSAFVHLIFFGSHFGCPSSFSFWRRLTVAASMAFAKSAMAKTTVSSVSEDLVLVELLSFMLIGSPWLSRKTNLCSASGLEKTGCDVHS